MTHIPVQAANPCLTHACAACCYDTEMPLTEEDVARLVAKGHDRNVFTYVDKDGILSLATVDRPEGMSNDGRSPADVAAGKPGRPCVFLQENKCSVYADRPSGCRIYPFVITQEGRLNRDDECPHHREFPMDMGARRRIQKIQATLLRETARRK